MRFTSILNLALGAATITQAPLVTATAHGHSLTPYEKIQQTLNTYALAVDSKNPALFPSVFATDATANYTGPISNLTGLDAIRDALLASVASLYTQHQLGTNVIDMADDGGTANSTMYFTASLFGATAENAGRFVILFGLYADELVYGDEGWRISHRQLVFMTPTLGNLTLG